MFKSKNSVYKNKIKDKIDEIYVYRLNLSLFILSHFIAGFRSDKICKAFLFSYILCFSYISKSDWRPFKHADIIYSSGFMSSSSKYDERDARDR